MPLSNTKLEIETQLIAIGSSDTWLDVLGIFADEIDNVILNGDHTQLFNSLSDYYPTANWSNIQNRVDGESDLSTISGGSNFTIDELSIPPFGQVTLSSSKINPIIQTWIVSGINGDQITNAIGFDPDNRSSLENNLTNGDLTSLVYNNTSRGNLQGLIFALDLNSAQNIGAITLYDWGGTNGPTYLISSGNVVTSNDGNNWTRQTNFANKPYNGNTGTQFVLPSPIVARYIGIEYIEGANNTFWVLSELEAYGPSKTGNTLVQIPSDNDLFSLYQDENTLDLIITNNTANLLNIKMKSDR